MEMSDYVLGIHVNSRLADAREAAARRALAGPPRPWVAPAVRAVIGGAHALYRRWATVSPASALPGDRPAGARPVP
jgi:hypothetical protein